MTNNLFPWHSSQWQSIKNILANKRFPHALLLEGQPGLGKAIFAREFARTLLCDKQIQNGCNICKACHLDGNHPDLFLIEPSEAVIKIDQIRELVPILQQTSFGDCKVIIIHSAEKMNLPAANSLLKILEEPPAQTFFLLVSSEPSLLIATIRSRCQKLSFSPDYSQAALSWLEAEGIEPSLAHEVLKWCEGSPLTALALGKDNGAALQTLQADILSAMEVYSQRFVIAKKWQEADFMALIDSLYLLISKCLKGYQQMSILINQKFFERLSNVHHLEILSFLQLLLSYRQKSLQGYNLNKGLVIDELLITLSQLVTNHGN